jgi:hypothetical protein
MKVTEYAAVCPRCGAKSPGERLKKSPGVLRRALGFAFGGAQVRAEAHEGRGVADRRNRRGPSEN